jgi:glutathione synthase/RimK-type ligase-like ATP-grasp enzyme
MTQLIFSWLGDVHAQAVIRALADRGETDVELLDLSEFPQSLTLSMEYDDDRRRFLLRRSGGYTLQLDKVRAVWWRRPREFVLPTAMTNAKHRQLAISEAGTAFQGLYHSMDALWVNDPRRDYAAGHKPFQLTLAQRIGLEIPPTLMTNDPDEARDFWRRHDGNVIYKQFLALPDAWRETRRVRPEEAELFAEVRWAPVIFQRYVDADADIRVTAVGEELFAGAADVRALTYTTDVRLNLGVAYRAHQLPDDVAARLRRLMRELGLLYGAIDMRLTPDGRYVFLEINPAGQFLYIEQLTGQKISAALAALLASASSRTRS